MVAIHLDQARTPDGMRLYAIGDVHGRLDLLAAMHERIEAEITRDEPADWRIVHLGDYVDRGPDSKGVIDFLIETCGRDKRNIALAGNHDIGLLDFLRQPQQDSLFVDNGGDMTARSYGVELATGNRVALALSHKALLAAVPQDHVDFLRRLAFSVSFGDFFFCHAGIRPGIALDRQDEFDLIWIRDLFSLHEGLFSKVIVHGHTPHAWPQVRPNRVNVDTQAYQSGRLSALVADGTAKEILTVVEDGSVQRSDAVTP
jgi:serine/threonine protein phosphatase 1